MTLATTPGLSAFVRPDRRIAERVPTRLKVWCEGDDFTLLTESINVSARGIFVRASSPPVCGTCFKATIEELGLVARVEVRWARLGRNGRAGMGLEVVGFEEGARALGEYIERARLALARALWEVEPSPAEEPA